MERGAPNEYAELVRVLKPLAEAAAPAVAAFSTRVVDRLNEPTPKDSGGGRSGSGDVWGRAAFVLASLSLAGILYHIVAGNSALDKRLDRIEERDRWNRWVLTGIAKKQDPNTELPPHPDD